MKQRFCYALYILGVGLITLLSTSSFAQDTTNVAKDTSSAANDTITVVQDTITVVRNSSAQVSTPVVNSPVVQDNSNVSKTSHTGKRATVDNGYYIIYPDELIFRLYLSTKFAPFTISSTNKQDLNYKTNSKLALGAGFTYKALTLNLAYGFNFLNPNKGKGNTKGLDLQFHIYPRKWAIDIIGSFLRGYYLDPKDYNGLSLTDYYKRPDLHRNIVGLSFYRVANPDKFSYRAAFNQKDWQTKSAGSLLYGAETYYGILKADSAFVPSWAGSNYVQAGINNIQFFSIGPGIGYAYTLVLSKHFFVTGSAIASVNLNISGETNAGNKNSKVKVLPGGNYKAALGYNSDSWSITAAVLGNAVYAGSSASRKEYFLPTGNVNFVVAKKFGTRQK